MKKIILSIVAMMTVVCGMAQSNDKSEHRQPMTVDQITAKMVTDLGLNDAGSKGEDIEQFLCVSFQGPGMNGGRPPKMDKGNSGSTGERPEMTDEQKQKMQTEMAQRQTRKNTEASLKRFSPLTSMPATRRRNLSMVVITGEANEEKQTNNR